MKVVPFVLLAGVLVLLVGLGIVAVPAGLLASALTKAREEEG